MIKKWLAGFLASILFAGVSIPVVASAEDVEDSVVSSVQCFADQHSAMKNGRITMHVIAHAVFNNSLDQAWVKVKVPAGTEIEGVIEGGQWLAAEGAVAWNMKAGNGADIFHLNLKVREDAGEQVTVGCALEIGGKAVVQGIDSTIHIGTEIHQPVFNGYPDGTYRPDSTMTRAEAATIVARELDLMDKEASRTFEDVPSSHWARVYIEKAAGAGYMVGDGTHFRPEDPVTLSEWIAIMLRVKGIHSVPLLGEITGIADGKWYANDAKTAALLGYFIPAAGAAYDSAIPREIAAQLFAIALFRGELTDGKEKVIRHWPDVPVTSARFGWIEELSLQAHESEQLGGLQEALVRYLPEQTEPF